MYMIYVTYHFVSINMLEKKLAPILVPEVGPQGPLPETNGSPLKMIGSKSGISVSRGLSSGAMLVSGRVYVVA